jgi:hypothetical protein
MTTYYPNLYYCRGNFFVVKLGEEKYIDLNEAPEILKVISKTRDIFWEKINSFNKVLKIYGPKFWDRIFLTMSPTPPPIRRPISAESRRIVAESLAFWNL